MAKQKGASNLVDQLKDAIRASGQSLGQISRASGVGTDRISRFVRGERDLTLRAAEKICDVLHLRLAGDPAAADVTEGPPPGPKAAAKKGRGKKGEA